MVPSAECLSEGPFISFAKLTFACGVTSSILFPILELDGSNFLFVLNESSGSAEFLSLISMTFTIVLNSVFSY